MTQLLAGAGGDLLRTKLSVLCRCRNQLHPQAGQFRVVVLQSLAREDDALVDQATQVLRYFGGLVDVAGIHLDVLNQPIADDFVYTAGLIW